MDLNQLTYFRGRVALAAILKAFGVKAGDDVLLQAFTCIAVPEAILSLGAVPRYVDVAAGSPNMDPEDLERKIGSRTRAVIVQHTFGLPADIVRIADVARRHDVPLIEDCAHTIASRVRGQRVGTFGAAAFYSFEASKPVFVGIGGSAVSNDAGLTARLKRDYAAYREPSGFTQLQLEAMRVAHRVAYRPSTYWTVRTVFRAVVATGLIRGNYNKVANAGEAGTSDQGDADRAAPSADFSLRMGRRQARLLRVGLDKLVPQTAHRRWVADEYRTRISMPGVSHIALADGDDPVYGRYPILVENRTEVLAGARRAKVELADFYATPVHPLTGSGLKQVAYTPGECPRAERIATQVVSLPTGLQVDAKQVERAVAFFNGFVEGSPA